MTAPKRKDYPWRRNIRRLLLVLFGLLGTAVLSFSVLAWRGGSAYQQQITAIRARGEPVTPSELARHFPAPAKAENAAESYGKAGESLKEAVSAGEYRSSITRISQAPAQEHFASAMHQWMKQYLKEHEEALRVLHEAAKDRNIRYDFDFSKGFSAPLPDFMQLHGSAQLLQIEAYAAAEDGDNARVTEAILAALAMDRPMREAPILIMQEMQRALRSKACTTIKRTLPTAAFSSEQLVQMQNALADTCAPEALTSAFIGERACGLNAYDQATGFVHMVMVASGDRERYLACMTEIVEASRLPCYEALPVIERMGTEQSGRWSILPSFSDIMVPNLFGYISRTGKEDAFVLGAEAALALERFRLANGHPPVQITELAPAFLPAVPRDPFDGQPLRYRTDEQGYAFYSIGENRKDDGGDDMAGKNLDVVFAVAFPSRKG